VRFDDRLRTVLAQPATEPHDRAVRWRQLVELAARSDDETDRGLFEQALATIREDWPAIPERVRSAAALSVAPLSLPAELVALFASDRLSVGAPVLASARLTASGWNYVASGASEESRSFIGSMQSGQTQVADRSRPETDDRSEGQDTVPSIGDLVARLERLRHRDEFPPEETDAAEEAPRLFQWECSESGQIEWVEGAPRGALVGQSIANGDGAVDKAVERAFAARAPFHGGTLEVAQDSRIGGVWMISGVPAFERASGRFAGYRGVAERPSEGRSDGAAAAADPDSLRELAHEIKTPLNAIIGFAEIISGEYLGPAERKYRDRAGDIVAQARLLLTAIDDLDFAAKTQSGTDDGRLGTNLGDLVERMVPSLRDLAAARGVALDASRGFHDLAVTTSPELAERMILRLCSAVIDRAGDGERLRLTVDNGGKSCSVSLSRPAALQGASDETLFGPADGTSADSFWLRLTRGMARVAGVELVASPGALVLAFPRA
jgi:signal transduction histidine kinase